MAFIQDSPMPEAKYMVQEEDSSTSKFYFLASPDNQLIATRHDAGTAFWPASSI